MFETITAGAPFAALRAYRQFIVYQLVPRPDGRTDKLPVNPHTWLVDASAHDPAIWLDATTAANYAQALGASYGVGFVFTAGDPFFFVDVDGALSSAGEWSDIAQWMVKLFDGALVEVSQSGRGLHIIGSGTYGEHRKKNAAHHLEYYTDGRFVALTGAHARGDAGTDHSQALAYLTQELFAPVVGNDGHPIEWTDAPCPEWRGPASDDELIRRACYRRQTAGSAFGSRVVFADLWEGNTDALTVAYPTASGGAGPYDASSADAALAAHLMFWTGRDCARVERLMRRSALMRAKWDDRDDYLRDRTIMNALRLSRDVLQDDAVVPPPGAVAVVNPDGPHMMPFEGATYLGPEQQVDLFDGCVYVADIHRAMLPGGKLYRPDQFRAHYGGYAYAMDAANERTSRNAWEAFTESQVYRAPRVDCICFKPNETPGMITDKGGLKLVNIYWPVDVPRRAGDPAPFLEHLARVLPEQRDRDILLAYMAACVQHKGYKFQWAPMIQGVQGNGKTLFSRCVAEAIGARYVHWPKASKLSNQFNGWMVGKIFYAVEDIYTPHNKDEILEDLKPMITGGDGLEIEGKGVDQISVDICGNFIFNCNKQTGLRKTEDDRRYAVFFTPQQRRQDLRRDGMHAEYFPKLYNWLKQDGGYAIVTDLLNTYAIPPELNPALERGGRAHIAPTTSTTPEALRVGVGRAEQELAEAISAARPGFRGGWISFTMFGALLKEAGLSNRLSPNARREILQAAGYDWHPGLHEGRSPVVAMPDGDKPRLFIAKGHPAGVLREAAAIVGTYSDAQK